jgi:hypothetical protein
MMCSCMLSGQVSVTLTTDLSRIPNLGKDSETDIIQLYTWEPGGGGEASISTVTKILCSQRVYTEVKGKIKLSLYRPWRPLGLREVKAPTFSDIRLTDGGKVVRPKRRPLFTPRKIPGTNFC